MDRKTTFMTLVVVLISIFIKIAGDIDLNANDSINYRPEISTTFVKVQVTSYMEMVTKLNVPVDQIVIAPFLQRRKKRKSLYLGILL